MPLGSHRDQAKGFTAGFLTGEARLSADAAMLVHIGVFLAFRAAGLAGQHARLYAVPQDAPIRETLAGQNPPRRPTKVRTIEV